MKVSFNFKQLVDDDRGVSPVIGVILMVAITVILAAVIASFVLGFGDSVQSNAQAGVTVDSGSVTLTSLGTNTEYVYCSSIADPESAGDATTNSQAAGSVGETFNCASSNNVVAVTSDGSKTVVREIE